MDTRKDPYIDILVCPNCKALNHISSVVCVGCGVRLDNYAEIRQNLNEHVHHQVQSRKEQWISEARDSSKKEKRDNTRRFLSRISIIFTGTVILAGLIWTGFIFHDIYTEMAEKKTEKQYNIGDVCFVQEDFICAQENYKIVHQLDPDYKDIREKLVITQLKLAEEYAQGGFYQLAFEELNLAIRLSPNDPQILDRKYNLHILLGDLYLGSAHWSRSVEEYKNALFIRPHDLLTLKKISDAINGWYQFEINNGNKIKAWWIKTNYREYFQ